MDNVKFAELVAKTGMHFGKIDGNYDDKERSFVNMFIGFLKVNSNFAGDVESVIRNASNQVCTVNQLIDETKEVLSDLSDERRKGTLESFANFIETVICVDGDKRSMEQSEFKVWKSALL